MYQDGPIGTAIETYYISTEITTFFVDISYNVSCCFSIFPDFSVFSKFLDFDEISGFLMSSFSESGKCNAISNAFHTYHTHLGLLYNIVFVHSGQALSGAVISGPVLLFYPDEKSIENILIMKKMPFHKKDEFMKILDRIPIISFERVCHLGKALYLICGLHSVRCDPVVQLTYGIKSPDTKTVYDRLVCSSYDENENDILKAFYEFLVEIKNSIIHGNLAETDKVLSKSTYLFNDLKAHNNDSGFMKNVCIILCTAACIYSVQANAPYERMMYISEKFINKVRTLNSSDEIISHLIKMLKTFTHAVAISTQNTNSPHINRILKYIEHHYTEKISLTKLSEYIHLNPYYLSSLIKKETKMSLSDNINKKRIEESKNLLIYTNKSVNEIAYAVGYSYQNHFNLVFKKLTGMTPLEFRKNNTQTNYFRD